MLCPKCGAEVPEGNAFCVNCGAQMNNSEPQAAPAQEPQPSQEPYVYGGNTVNNNPQQNTYYNNQTPPPGKPLSGTTYLVLSILALLFCCLPGGIAGIVYSTKIDKLWAMGDYAGAQDAAKKSKMWIIISAVVGVIVMVAYFALIMAGAISGLNY